VSIFGRKESFSSDTHASDYYGIIQNGVAFRGSVQEFPNRCR
jgi:hypothetical protein